MRQEFRNQINDLKANNPVKLDKKEKQILEEIKDKGFYVIPNFYNNEICLAMRQEINHLMEKYKAGLFIDKEDSDHRAFGANRLSDLIDKFYNHPFINKIVKAHEKTNNISGLTMAAKIECKPSNKGSGGGWHRDWAMNKQIKAILYLSDVNSTSGPFQYLEGSQKHYNVIRDCYLEKLDFNQNRFADSEIEHLIAKKYPSELHTFTGKAGTLILVNTRGIHRGMPLEQGVRYALTNYYWSNMPIPEHITKTIIKP